MPADFNEIADYHRQEAARHAELALLAQENWSRAEAAYHRELALRHTEAAREQMEQDKKRQPEPLSVPPLSPRRPVAPAVHLPLAARFVTAAVQGAGQLAAVIRHAVQDRGGGGPQGISPR